MTKPELIQWLESKGYVKNKWGHYVRADRPNYRFKLAHNSVKIEKSSRMYDGRLLWSRIRGNYYCYLSIDSNGKLVGMSYKSLRPYKYKSEKVVGK